ncbi:MAG: tetratricopeptide repeat protein [Aureliella sp.]
MEASDFHSQGKFTEAAERAEKAAELVPDSFAVQQRAAETLYLSGFSDKSLIPFDRAVKLAPDRAADNWQRGLALATSGKFKAGAKQFETHHRVNPDDVENSAWYFLCVAKSEGIEKAREALIPSRGDPREPMMSILAMLSGKLAPDEVMKAAVANTQPGSSRRTAQLYADLYVGLYHDSLGDAKNAAKFLKRSLTYSSTGYMADTARVYYEERFKKSEKTKRSAAK